MKKNPVKKTLPTQQSEKAFSLPMDTLKLVFLERLKKINPQYSDEVDEQTKEQLYSRDVHIAQLNDEIISLKTTLEEKKQDGPSAKDKDSRIAQLESQLEERKRLHNELQDQHHNLQEELQQVRIQLEDEKESSVMIQNELTEEIEDLKTRLSQKEAELKEIKADFGQVNKIIQQLTGLNRELNEKIDKINSEMENANKRCYEAESKAVHIEELQKELEEYAYKSQQHERQAIKLQKAVEKMARNKVGLEQCSVEQQERLRGIADEIQQITFLIMAIKPENLERDKQDLSVQLQDQAKGVSAVRHQLKAVTPAQVQTVEQELEIPDNDVAQIQVRELQETIKRNARKVKEAEQKEAHFQEQSVKFKQLVEKQRADSEEAVSSANKRAEVFQEQYDRLNEKIRQITKTLDSKESELKQAQTKLFNMQAQMDIQKKKAADAVKVRDDVQKQAAEAMQRAKKAKENALKSQQLVKQREVNYKKMQNQLQTLRKELESKDTNVISKNRDIKQMIDINERLRRDLEQLQATLKQRIEKAVATMKANLEAKEQEIEVMKSMFKGVQAEVKVKDGDLQRVKRKLQQVADSPATTRKAPNSTRPVQHNDSQRRIEAMTDDDVFTRISEFVRVADEAYSQAIGEINKSGGTTTNSYNTKIQRLLGRMQQTIPERVYTAVNIINATENDRFRQHFPSKKKLTKDDLLEIFSNFTSIA